MEFIMKIVHVRVNIACNICNDSRIGYLFCDILMGQAPLMIILYYAVIYYIYILEIGQNFNE